MIKLAIPIRNIAQFISILVNCSSCHRQNAPDAVGVQKQLGDTVTEMDKHVTYVFQDSKDNYWFGADDAGVYRYKTGNKYFIHSTQQHGLTKGRIRGIQEDRQGNIYVNTDGGVSRFDGQSVSKLSIVNNNPPNGDWSLQPDDLWFTGAQDSGVVYRYDGHVLHRLHLPKTEAYHDFVRKFPRAKFPAMTFDPYDAYSIYKDRQGSLWFGTNLGLCRYDGRHFDWMTESEIGIDAISIHVRSTIEDRNGKFWFGNTMHRFKVYPNSEDDSKDGKVVFKEESGIVGSKDHGAAYFLSAVEDNNGHLWTATYNAGAWRYSGKELTNFRIRDGEKDVTLFTIYKDNYGIIWLGTHEDGVYKFNGKEFKRFDL